MTTAANDYLGVHLYYHVWDLRSLITDCVKPLTRELIRDRLIDRYFMIRYWERGTHVRLRLLPRPGVGHDTLKTVVEPAVSRFFAERPSLFDPIPEQMSPFMRTLFVMEYGEAAYRRKYGDGDIPLEPNNSLAYIPYEPESGRYGGAAGVALSERHFHCSSDIAIEILEDTAAHLRPAILGVAFQVMLHFALAMLERPRLAAFFRRYADSFAGVEVTAAHAALFDAQFLKQQARLAQHLQDVEGLQRTLLAFADRPIGRYVEHGKRLRAEVLAAFDAGTLEFDPPAHSLQEALERLLTSYTHMMNNRLGVLILEEVYMARLIADTLEPRP